MYMYNVTGCLQLCCTLFAVMGFNKTRLEMQRLVYTLQCDYNVTYVLFTNVVVLTLMVACPLVNSVRTMKKVRQTVK